MNIANKLTIFRIALIFIFIALFYSEIHNYMLYATIVFIVASFTDFLDGYLARKYNIVTTFGKFMDPLADKLLVLTAFTLLVEANIVQGWVLIILLFREFSIMGIRVLAASEGITISANILGKIKTIFQILSIIFLMLNLPFSNIILYVSIFFTIISFIDYLYKNRCVLKSIKDI